VASLFKAGNHSLSLLFPLCTSSVPGQRYSRQCSLPPPSPPSEHAAPKVRTEQQRDVTLPLPPSAPPRCSRFSFLDASMADSPFPLWRMFADFFRFVPSSVLFVECSAPFPHIFFLIPRTSFSTFSFRPAMEACVKGCISPLFTVSSLYRRVICLFLSATCRLRNVLLDSPYRRSSLR